MSKSFTISLLFASALAAPGNLHGGLNGLGKLGGDPAFNDFNAQFNKGPSSVGDYLQRQQIFHANQNTINQHNRGVNQNDPSALKLKMNWTGDLTPEEYAQLITLDQA